MRSLCCVGLFLFGQLSADVAIVFDSYNGPAGEFLDPNKYFGEGNILSGLERVDFELRKKGEKVIRSNLSDAELPRLRDPSVTFVMSNTPKWTRPDWREFLAKLPGKKILVCWEPPVVMPEMYEKEEMNFYDVVLTWNTKLVDNKKFFQFYYPVLSSFVGSSIPFAERRVLTQISGNKKSFVKNELYSLRREAILYFEKHSKADFCFYGKGWENLNFKTYGGSVSDKLSTLQKYRFSLCFENVKHIHGYVTEKIFDCLSAGCVPVYFGASDIGKYIPKNCYIQWKKYKKFGRLYKFLERMPEKKYIKYIRNIKAFLESKKAQKFTSKAFSFALLKAVAVSKISAHKNFVVKSADRDLVFQDK